MEYLDWDFEENNEEEENVLLFIDIENYDYCEIVGIGKVQKVPERQNNAGFWYNFIDEENIEGWISPYENVEKVS